MARKSSKRRRRARLASVRSALSELVGRHIAVQVEQGGISVMAAVGSLAEPDRGRAIELGQRLRGEA
jgi:hypothetical protein